MFINVNYSLIIMTVLIAEIYNGSRLVASGSVSFSQITNPLTFNFNEGSSMFKNGMLSLGSAGLIEGNKGAMIQLRMDEKENRIKLNFCELYKKGNRWYNPNIDPCNYSGTHYIPPNSDPIKVIVLYQVDGKNPVFLDSKII